jgi:uncharacterized protein YuzE
LKVIYDAETDTLSLILRDKPVVESDEVREGIIIDYGEDGRLVSIEMLDASENITKPQEISYELKERAVLAGG